MGPKISKISDDIDISFDVPPPGPFEPLSHRLAGGEVVALVRCHLCPHFVQVQVRFVEGIKT